jgi:sucrose-6-phosphate hydrolase SacC (GH32 family)
MNPFVIRQGGEYFLFYAGGTRTGGRLICLATCPVDAIGAWTRHGPLFDLGGPGSFDATWCVLPAVHKFGDTWHLYYTGRNPELGEGLQCFTGIGLATSKDLRHWKRYSEEPVLRGDGFEQWPDNKGIAGGGSLIEIPQPDGQLLYRMYYTLATGTKSPDMLVDQEKHSVVAHSYDGIEWFDRRVVLQKRAEADYENAATIGLNVWKEGQTWRAIYAGIGTKFGFYSLCEAESADGLNWHRGEPGENLSLKPQGTGWESQMVEYPNLIEENGRLRLFYCGNGYGATGIGSAVADKLTP